MTDHNQNLSTLRNIVKRQMEGLRVLENRAPESTRDARIQERQELIGALNEIGKGYKELMEGRE